MSEDHDRIVQLTYAVGLAIGALEAINLPSEFNVDGLKRVLDRLRAITETVTFVYVAPDAKAAKGRE